MTWLMVGLILGGAIGFMSRSFFDVGSEEDDWSGFDDL